MAPRHDVAWAMTLANMIRTKSLRLEVKLLIFPPKGLEDSIGKTNLDKSIKVNFSIASPFHDLFEGCERSVLQIPPLRSAQNAGASKLARASRSRQSTGVRSLRCT